MIYGEKRLRIVISAWQKLEKWTPNSEEASGPAEEGGGGVFLVVSTVF